MLLEVEGLAVSYGKLSVLDGVSMRVRQQGFVSVLGSNNAGKSTLINCLSGVVPAKAGSIIFRGEDITSMPPHRRVEMGLIQVPEGRQLFPNMTVYENLLMGAVVRKRRKAGSLQSGLDYVYHLFPKLKDRSKQMAGSLSGGEQQMVAVARGLMSKPDLLMLDEPSLGLAPLIVDSIFEALATLNRDGMTVLLVEQNLALSLEYADSGYVLERGEVVLHGTAAELKSNDQTRVAYLGM